MSLTAADFIAPAGELTPGLFPGENLTTLVSAWLVDAVALTDDEARQRHWVLHRAYVTVSHRFHVGLASESKGPVSASRSEAQFKYWAALADRHLRGFSGASMYRPVF
jgi:hypothetical protein